MSACRYSKSGSPSSARKFSREPVMRLSSASTRTPLSSRAAQRCEPMKPAPPETTARGFAGLLLAANSSVREPEVTHRGGIVDVAPVDHDRPPHRLFDPSEVEVPKLVPLRDHDHGIGAGGSLVRVIHVLDVGEDSARALHGRGVVGPHHGAGG